MDDPETRTAEVYPTLIVRMPRSASQRRSGTLATSPGSSTSAVRMS